MRAHRRPIAALLASVATLVVASSLAAAPAGAGARPSCAGPSGPSAPSQSASVTYVCHLYVDLLLRSSRPSQGELDFWAGRLASGPRVDVTRSFEGADEHSARLVDNAYRDFLGRVPDSRGKADWIDKLRRGVPLELVDAAILASPEGYGHQGGTNADFVDAVYSQYLNRVPGPSERTFWANRIVAKGNDYPARYAVTLEISLSDEARGLTAGSLYTYWLGRQADSGGRSYWAGQIRERGVLAVEAVFIAQDEVFARLSTRP